jgi:ElaB/YqjD/DUF883 family membrane-anchored ribosome-binding protein
MSLGPSNPTREEATSFTDTAKEAVSSAVDKTKDAVSSVAEKISDAASSVAQKTTDVASAVTHRTEEAMHTVADTVGASSRYVREQGISGMTADLGDVIRRNPLPSLAIGFTIGFLISQALTRRD